MYRHNQKGLVMGLALRKQDQKYTYADYLSWPDNERWEILDGTAYNMSPAPLIEHQRITMELSGIIWSYLRGKPCKVFVSPIDVYIPKQKEDSDDKIENVVQPDVIVVCDHSKIEKRGIRGAPDIVIEVLSPQTEKKDWNDKFNLYEKSGVKEYWIVDPSEQVVHQYVNTNNRFNLVKMHEAGSVLESSVITGLKVEMIEIYGERKNTL
jgi:Uma2 family endonuclease